MTGFDFGVGDGAVGFDIDEQDNNSADVHAVGELWVHGRYAGDDLTMNVASQGGTDAEREASQEQEWTRRAKSDCQVNLQG